MQLKTYSANKNEYFMTHFYLEKSKTEVSELQQVLEFVHSHF